MRRGYNGLPRSKLESSLRERPEKRVTNLPQIAIGRLVTDGALYDYFDQLEETAGYKLYEGDLFLSMYDPESFSGLIGGQPKFEGPSNRLSRNSLRKAKKHIARSMRPLRDRDFELATEKREVLEAKRKAQSNIGELIDDDVLHYEDELAEDIWAPAVVGLQSQPTLIGGESFGLVAQNDTRLLSSAEQVNKAIRESGYGRGIEGNNPHLMKHVIRIFEPKDDPYINIEVEELPKIPKPPALISVGELVIVEFEQ